MSVAWTFKKKTLPSTVLELKKKKRKKKNILAITTLERKKNEENYHKYSLISVIHTKMSSSKFSVSH